MKNYFQRAKEYLGRMANVAAYCLLFADKLEKESLKKAGELKYSPKYVVPDPRKHVPPSSKEVLERDNPTTVRDKLFTMLGDTEDRALIQDTFTAELSDMLNRR